MKAVDRLLRMVIPEPNSGCWLWTGSTERGYGMSSVKSRPVKAHRLSFVLFCGPIPDGLFICHKCNNRLCVNPHHLYAGDKSANTHDSVRAGTHIHARKTHCPKGHEYSGDNLMSMPYSNYKWRWCRVCAKESHGRRYIKQKLLKQKEATNA